MKSVEIGVVVLLVLVIAGAWFAGLSTDAQTFGGVFNKLFLTLQGRNANGTFPAYPAGAPGVNVTA